MAVEVRGAKMELDLLDKRERALPRDVSSLESLFGLVRQFCAEADLDADLVPRAELVAEELFTNLVKYNPEGRAPIEVLVGRSRRWPEGLTLRFVDRGVHAFDPRGAPTADLDAPLEERRPGRLGLYLVQQMVDSLDYHHEAGDSSTTVVLLPRPNDDGSTNEAAEKAADGPPRGGDEC